MKFKITVVLLFTSFFIMQAQWVQLGENVEGENPMDLLGNSLSMSSNGLIFAAGASTNGGGGVDSGYAVVYENVGGVWQQIGTDIDGETAGDIFGISSELNASGSIVAIGASMTGAGADGPGYAKVYEYSNGEWLPMGDTINGNGASGDSFGYSLSLSSDGLTVAIGAIRNDVNGFSSGQARVFNFINGVWTQLGQDLFGEDEGDFFGSSISLNDNGSILAVGARLNDENGTNAGHVRIFEIINNVWTQLGQNIDGEGENDRSGQSVMLDSSGTIVAIGADGNSENGIDSGQVRVFEYNNGVWIQIGQDIDGQSADARFGFDIDLNSDGTVLIVSAPTNNDVFNVGGKVLVFENQNGDWAQIGNDLNGQSENDAFGGSVCISDTGGKIGTAGRNDSNNSNAGYISVYGNENLGISDFNEANISFYPNPTNGVVNFKFSDTSAQKIIVSDITGKILMEKIVTQQNEVLNISNLEKGIYLVSVLLDETIFTTKIIKK